MYPEGSFMDFTGFGRMLIVVAALLLIAGLIMIGLGKLGLGRLPGDLVYRRDGTTIYFPITTSILISIILSLILTPIVRLLSRGK